MLSKATKSKLLHLGLFILTFFTTTLAGVEWTLNKYLVLGISWSDFVQGFSFSVPFLLILTVHEFGHYFTARYHHIQVSLPYYIPMWLGFVLAPSIGTMGAFIRIRDHISSRKKYFDVGISGPLAGFVVALFILWYGFSHLPPKEYIYSVHPEYIEYPSIDEAIDASEGTTIHIGGNLLFNFFKNFVADSERLPHNSEMMHYPWILAGYLALFFTALNLLPIGQLDGGHILFGLLGDRKHAVVSRIFFTAFVFYAGMGWLTVDDIWKLFNGEVLNVLLNLFLYFLLMKIIFQSVFKNQKNVWLAIMSTFAGQLFIHAIWQAEGYTGWIVLAVIISKFMGVDHATTVDQKPLDIKRQILGWIALAIFVLCFSPNPLVVENI